MLLREYQSECLEHIEEKYALGVCRQLIHLPTAAGKTVIFAHLTNRLNCRTLVLAPMLELLEQAKDKIKMICPELEVGLVNANSKEFDYQVVVSSIQSARQPENLKQLQKQQFKLCIADEAHFFAADSPRTVLESLGFSKGCKGSLLAGFSATPFRNDNKGLGEVFDEVVYKKTIKDLIALGFLCQPKGIKIKSDLDLSTVRTENGDFVTTALADVMDTPAMIELVVNSFIENAANRKTVCFSVTVSHAKRLAEAFRGRGIASEAIYGDMSQSERSAILENFQKGSIQVLTNCQILTTGWDAPEVDCVIVAKPTQSKSLFIQMAGRGLRLFPNKKNTLILDFGSQDHSLCSTACLDGGVESDENQKPKVEGKLSEFAKTLPPTINRKLKASIIEFDLLGDAFTWLKDGQSYYLKAIGDKILKIVPIGKDRFDVLFFNVQGCQTIAKSLSFEYAFNVAESFAKDNRALFTVSDLEASWRTLPISDKQKGLFRSFGFKAGIEDLSRGQAAIIISSGVLKKKSAVGGV